jgi:integrase
VPLFNEDNKVERYLNEDELQCLLGVLRTDENRMVCQIALFLLSTGARLNEALQAKGGQIDRGAAGVADFSRTFQVQTDAVCAPE